MSKRGGVLFVFSDANISGKATVGQGRCMGHGYVHSSVCGANWHWFAATGGGRGRGGSRLVGPTGIGLQPKVEKRGLTAGGVKTERRKHSAPISIFTLGWIP